MSDLSKIWDKVRKPLGAIAPLLGSALGPGGSIVGTMVAEVLGVEDNPDSVAQALETVSPEKKAELLALQENNRHELQKLTLQKAISDNELDASIIGDVNETMRAETAQGHPWSGAWRPFWGFCSAIAFVLAVLGIFAIAGYAIYKADAALFSHLPTLIFYLAALFAIPGGILGVTAYHRGIMQRVEAGDIPKPGLMDALVSRVMK